MLKIFKKTFWIDPSDSSVYPNLQQTRSEIVKYCEKNGYSYVFTNDDEVVIDGIPHEIWRGLSFFSRGNYVIKCREK